MENGRGDTGVDNPAFENDPQMAHIVSGNQPEKEAEGKTPLEFECDDDHRLPLENVLKQYGSNAETGLTEEQVLANRQKYGINVLAAPKKKSLPLKCIKKWFGGLNLLFWMCGLICIISYGAQYLIEPTNIAQDNTILFASIMVVVAVSAFASFYREFKSDEIMESFKKMVPQKCVVIRNGNRVDLELADIVVGDVVQVKDGDLVPADIRVLESNNFKVDNSSLTGESEPQTRSPECTNDDRLETKNLAFFGAYAVEGIATGLVVRTGSNTMMGQLESLASNVNAGDTSLGFELYRFIGIMTVRFLFFGGIFFVSVCYVYKLNPMFTV